jgi:hypothetical protein
MRDAVGDYACLPAARAGQNEHRPVSGFDSLTLLGIELGEKGQLRGDTSSNFTGHAEY